MIGHSSGYGHVAGLTIDITAGIFITCLTEGNAMGVVTFIVTPHTGCIGFQQAWIRRHWQSLNCLSIQFDLPLGMWIWFAVIVSGSTEDIVSG
jgi:hypothetical protein